MTNRNFELFKMGFYDAFEGRDCKLILKKYVKGYMKGRETAKSCGLPTYKRIQ